MAGGGWPRGGASSRADRSPAGGAMAPPREQTPGHGRSVGPGPGAPTDELHGREPQVPVGAAQVRRGLHEELPVVTKAALHLRRRRRGWLPASALALSEAPASPAAPGPERTAVTRPGVGGSAGPRPFFPPSQGGLCSTIPKALQEATSAPSPVPGPTPPTASAGGPGPLGATGMQGGHRGSSARRSGCHGRPCSLPWECAGEPSPARDRGAQGRAVPGRWDRADGPGWLVSLWPCPLSPFRCTDQFVLLSEPGPSAPHSSGYPDECVPSLSPRGQPSLTLPREDLGPMAPRPGLCLGHTHLGGGAGCPAAGPNSSQPCPALARSGHPRSGSPLARPPVREEDCPLRPMPPLPQASDPQRIWTRQPGAQDRPDWSRLPVTTHSPAPRPL